jgi:hypothetical protein
MTPRARASQTLFMVALLLAGCTDEEPLNPGDDRLAAGTWGGENVAFIVSDSTLHVHIGCTNGTFFGPVLTDENGRFTVNGQYILRAHPIQIGPPLPAQLSGVVTGSTVTFSVAVNDTTPVSLGPVAAVRGRDPRMGPCPVCTKQQE